MRNNEDQDEEHSSEVKSNKHLQEKRTDGDYLETWQGREVGIKHGINTYGWVYGNHLLRHKTQDG